MDYKLITILCENILQEASSLTQFLPKNQTTSRFINALHKSYGVPHDQAFEPTLTNQIDWTAAKDTRYGTFMIFPLERGLGAIIARSRKGGYQVLTLANGEEEIRAPMFSRANEAIAFLKNNLGKLVGKQVYVGSNTSDRIEKDSAREKNRLIGLPSQITTEKIFLKFKPLFKRIITHAKADIKGMVMTMLKNNAYDRAYIKLQRIRELDDLMKQLENTDIAFTDRENLLRKHINLALLLTASKYYPENTGEIRRQRYGANPFSPESSVGPNQILRDISNGKLDRLSSLLGYFKRSVITGY
jgi:hypothetical protein